MSRTWFTQLDRTATADRRVAQQGGDGVAQRARRDRSAHIGAGCLVALAAGLTGLFGSACSGSHPAQIEGGVAPQHCSGSALCVGATIHKCQEDMIGAQIEDCSADGQVCSQARCTSRDCQMAEANASSVVGCLFYTLVAETVAQDQGNPTSFLVSNPGGDAATVEIQRPNLGVGVGANGTTQWTGGTSTAVQSGQSGRLVLPGGLEVTGIGTRIGGAVRISSDRPVTVVEIESDDVAENATSTGGTMILPLQSLGIGYLPVTYPQMGTPAIANTTGSRGGAGRVMVIGTQMGTTIHFIPSGPVSAAPGDGFDGLAAGEDYPVLLDDGDVFQIYSGADGEDLTGCQVTAGQPIAVFSGNISTTYGSQVTGINSPDMAHEQMPPIATWSQTYVAASLTPQSNIDCTSFFGTTGASIWRVLASADDTTVTFEGPGAGTLQLLPPGGVAAPLQQPLALDAGQSASLIGVGSFTVAATNPILVTQGMDCEPSLSLAIAVDAGTLVKSLPFAALPNFDQLLGIVRPQSAEVDLDGSAIPDGAFQSVGGGFEVAEVPLGACPANQGVCPHLLTGAVGFGMTLRGMDVQSSYALTAPGLRCDPGTGVCLN